MTAYLLRQAATDMGHHAQTEKYADFDIGEINFNTFHATSKVQCLESWFACTFDKMVVLSFPGTSGFCTLNCTSSHTNI